MPVRQPSTPLGGAIEERLCKPQPPTFFLDDEERYQVKNCLRKSGITSTGELLKKFCAMVEASIQHHLSARALTHPSGAAAHEALRDLWFLAQEHDPRVGQIRTRVITLPAKALEYIDDRAANVLPRLFPGDSAEGGFVAWARQAEGKKLIEAVQALSADGGRVVQGRSRGEGKRAQPRLEPVIFGRAKGVNDGLFKGGRPTHANQDTLVQHLALDWRLATGVMPSSGRSDKTGFGSLVHGVFDWIEEPGATQALRRFWSVVKTAKITPTPDGRGAIYR